MISGIWFRDTALDELNKDPSGGSWLKTSELGKAAAAPAVGWPFRNGPAGAPGAAGESRLRIFDERPADTLSPKSLDDAGSAADAPRQTRGRTDARLSGEYFPGAD